MKNQIQTLRGYNGVPGIYVLIKDQEVIYIGSTSDLYRRTLEHTVNHKDYDRVYFTSIRFSGLNKILSKSKQTKTPMQKELMQIIEMALICSFDPPQNTIKFDNYVEWFLSLPSLIGSYKITLIQMITYNLVYDIKDFIENSQDTVKYQLQISKDNEEWNLIKSIIPNGQKEDIQTNDNKEESGFSASEKLQIVKGLNHVIKINEKNYQTYKKEEDYEACEVYKDEISKNQLLKKKLVGEIKRT